MSRPSARAHCGVSCISSSVILRFRPLRLVVHRLLCSITPAPKISMSPVAQAPPHVRRMAVVTARVSMSRRTVATVPLGPAQQNEPLWWKSGGARDAQALIQKLNKLAFLPLIQHVVLRAHFCCGIPFDGKNAGFTKVLHLLRGNVGPSR
jgi:hypothetical protein